MEEENNNDQGSKGILFFLWIFSLVIVGVFGFLLGKSGNNTNNSTANNAAVVTVTLPASTPVAQGISPIQTEQTDLEGICEKSGPSQKKDYLVPYILKAGDSFQSIAESELGDSTRVSELTTLNSDQTNLTVGSTIYLPPKDIKSSSGHIVEVSGKIIQKDNASWQISYGGGEKGPGVWIPAYYMKDIPNLSDFKVGDCVTILLDNGVKAYSVRKS